MSLEEKARTTLAVLTLITLFSTVSCRTVMVGRQEHVSPCEKTVYIQPGTFLMGSLNGQGEDSEHPQHKVSVSGFWMDTCEVTNRKFKEFVDETGYVTDAEKRGKGWIWDDEWKEMPGADWRHPKGPSTSIEAIMNHPVVQVSVAVQHIWHRRSRAFLVEVDRPWSFSKQLMKSFVVNRERQVRRPSDTCPADSAQVPSENKSPGGE